MVWCDHVRVDIDFSLQYVQPPALVTVTTKQVHTTCTLSDFQHPANETLSTMLRDGVNTSHVPVDESW